MPERMYVALDLGAESGRAMLANFSGDTLTVEEVYRFANEPVWYNGEFHWDLPRLWREIGKALGRSGSTIGRQACGHRCGYLGTGLRAARRGWDAARESVPLSRSTNGWHDRACLPGRSGGRDLRDDRHPVHADQYPLSALRRVAEEACPAPARSEPRYHPGSAQLLAHRRSQPANTPTRRPRSSSMPVPGTGHAACSSASAFLRTF